MNLDEIEARANAATPPPWPCWADEDIRRQIQDDLGRLRPVVAPCDAEFIAHAREDIPALIAEIRRLKKAMIAALDAAREGFPLPADSWIRILTHALGDDAPKWPEPRRKP